MKASILIVSKNRKADLEKTLVILESILDFREHEVRIFLDGCTDGSERLEQRYEWAYWEKSKRSIGASKARNILYQQAKGRILFGFDDDSHPLQDNFVELTQTLFDQNLNVGIIGFYEIPGLHKDIRPLIQNLKHKKDYLTNDFIGCGFAVKKEIYDQTRGFPTWIDIYGEEICVAWETLDIGYDILFTHKIYVNHRIDKNYRKQSGTNSFRFQKQLKNTTLFYLVYYPFPLLVFKISKLYYKNLIKYGLNDVTFFRAYFGSLSEVGSGFFKALKFRRPLSKLKIKKFSSFPPPKY